MSDSEKDAKEIRDIKFAILKAIPIDVDIANIIVALAEVTKIMAQELLGRE